MKNIDVTYLHEMDEFNDLENLPFTEGMHKRTDIDPWRYWGGRYHKINGKFPYKIIVHALNKFVGKSINKAFKYDCSLVPQYMQNYFWDDIEDDEVANWRWRFSGYYIDKRGNVKKQKKETSPRKYIYIGKEHVTKKFFIYSHKNHPKYGRRLPPEIKVVKSIIYDEELAEGTDEYNREIAERLQAKKVNTRLYYENKKNQDYDFQRLKREKKANEEDELIRDNHGFDDKSFKGIEYHGRKRKREKKKNKLHNLEND